MWYNSDVSGGVERWLIVSAYQLEGGVGSEGLMEGKS